MPLARHSALLLPLIACGACGGGAAPVSAVTPSSSASSASSVKEEKPSGGPKVHRHRVAVGALHECAIVHGAIKCWGDNDHGQLGSSSPPPRHASVEAIKSGATAVVAGDMHTCALVEGALLCWGWGSRGQLGFVAREAHPVPTRVPLAGKVVDVAADEKITCAALEDESVWCWGANGNDRIGIAEPTKTAVRGSLLTMIGSSTICARHGTRLRCQSFDGEKVTVASPRPPTEKPVDTDAEVRSRFGLASVDEVVGFWSFTCAIGDGGRVRCAGMQLPWDKERGKTERVADFPLVGAGHPIAIGANPSRVCALLDDDSLACSNEERRRR